MSTIWFKHIRLICESFKELSIPTVVSLNICEVKWLITTQKPDQLGDRKEHKKILRLLPVGLISPIILNHANLHRKKILQSPTKTYKETKSEKNVKKQALKVLATGDNALCVMFLK